MKQGLLIAALAFFSVVSYARKHVSDNATVVADTIYYAADKSRVQNCEQAEYYRLLMKQNKGIGKIDVFQDFYMNGQLKAEGEYSFIALGNDAFLMVRLQPIIRMEKRNGMVNMSMGNAMAISHFICVKVALLWYNLKMESQCMTILW